PDYTPEHQPSRYRHYVIELFPGIVRPELAKKIHSQFSLMPMNKWKQSIKQAQKKQNYRQIITIDEALASGVLHMILTRFAEASDEITDRAAYRNGVAVIRSLPRVLIASVAEVNKAYEFSMDLRLDEVDAIPFPGVPIKAVRLFQMGRGFLQSAAEGQILELFTEGDVVTTSSLMTQAQSEGISFKVVDASQLNSFLKKSALPKNVRNTLKGSITNGWEIIIPEKPVKIAGVDRWGWWQVEKSSGRYIGVMDNGLHAALVEVNLSSSKIGIQPKMGFAIGMIVGGNSTLFAISGLMIKHGQVTPAMIKEVKDYIKTIRCSSCPKIEAKIEGSYGVGGDCLKIELKEDLSAKASIDFCEQYVKGFKCAASLLMAGLTGQSIVKAEIKHEVSYEAGCAGDKEDMSISRDL
ncbi:MAG: hypothetical protein DRI70_09105, partial [Bacteroidetes bacterium]